MTFGQGSLSLHKVDIECDDGTIELLEKTVRMTSNEVSFWRAVDQFSPVLDGHNFESIKPVGLVESGKFVMMYFHYLADLDQDRQDVKSEFRANVAQTVSAVASFNGSNPWLPNSRPLGRDQAFRSEMPRPSLIDLQEKLSVSSGTAQGFQREWDEVRDKWPAVKSTYDLLPRCLCHNDVGPGNAFYRNGITKFLDFARAGIGPVGSDLHTVIRWSAEPLMRSDDYEHLFTAYLSGLRTCGISLSIEQLRLAVWTTFYLRYADLTWRSARNPDVFSLAIRKMKQLIDHPAVE